MSRGADGTHWREGPRHCEARREEEENQSKKERGKGSSLFVMGEETMKLMQPDISDEDVLGLGLVRTGLRLPS